MRKISRLFTQKNAAFEKTFTTASGEKKYYSLNSLNDKRVDHLPFSIRVLLESALRNYDEFVITPETVESIANWAKSSADKIEIPFKPARVILQDFTGVPAVVDLAAMRDAVHKLKDDPKKINPLCPVDLVIDHSVQVDIARTPEARKENERIEFERNYERFKFLKWGQTAFQNFKIVPPGNGIVHQVNLEYLARVVFDNQGVMFPDSVVGTDSHTTMINGLGVLGWGVGGIEAEAVMLGQHISMVLPEVIGVQLTGKLRPHVTATDLVLTLTDLLRKRKVVGKFVEFFGSGVSNLSIEDRSTVANMAPEYGATIGYFPVDDKNFEYLIKTGRDEQRVKDMREYLKTNSMLRDFSRSDKDGIGWTGEVLHLDLSTVEPSLAGPKRPQDRINLSDVAKEFREGLTKPVTFKSFGLKPDVASRPVELSFRGKNYTLPQGAVVIAAITSCTNTSNPDVLIGAGLLAKKAAEKGLSVAPYIKTSLSPGSGVVEEYLSASGLLPHLEKMGFYMAGLGCMTCIGNSGDLDPELTKTLIENPDLIVSAVLSGNRNFEGRVHPLTRANYLASPLLVLSYALAGSVDFDFDTQPLGQDASGKDVFLKDIWPSKEEIKAISDKFINRELFTKTYAATETSNQRWNELKVTPGELYKWEDSNTYIHNPPFFKELKLTPAPVQDIIGSHCLLYFGDSITTDHISPAGKISSSSPAAKYLVSKGVKQVDFNTYGARRGNDEIMQRGTFANIRLINKLVSKPGPTTVFFPSNEEDAIFDVSEKYKSKKIPTIIIAGNEYGSGSSRDWAAKGPALLGVRAVIAQSFERIHRSNLIGMGILPLEFQPSKSLASYDIDPKTTFDIFLNNGDLKVNQLIEVRTGDGKKFDVIARLDTPIEVEYFKNGGILSYVLRNLAKSK